MTNEEKHIGANIPEHLFWVFKENATKKKDNTKQAIMKALYLYIDSSK